MKIIYHPIFSFENEDLKTIEAIKDLLYEINETLLKTGKNKLSVILSEDEIYTYGTEDITKIIDFLTIMGQEYADIFAKN